MIQPAPLPREPSEGNPPTPSHDWLCIGPLLVLALNWLKIQHVWLVKARGRCFDQSQIAANLNPNETDMKFRELDKNNLNNGYLKAQLNVLDRTKLDNDFLDGCIKEADRRYADGDVPADQNSQLPLCQNESSREAIHMKVYSANTGSFS